MNWNKYEAWAFSEEWNQNYGFDLKIQRGTFLPPPLCDSCDPPALLLVTEWD